MLVRLNGGRRLFKSLLPSLALVILVGCGEDPVVVTEACPDPANMFMRGGECFCLQEQFVFNEESQICQMCDDSCEDRICGFNQCNRTCGVCAPGERCTAGACFPCEPDCGGKECGSDGCGGDCGSCAEGECVDGMCCMGDCAGRECGSDGCNGSCGACDSDELCGPDGTCQPNTTGTGCGTLQCGFGPRGQSCGFCGPGTACTVFQTCYPVATGCCTNFGACQLFSPTFVNEPCYCITPQGNIGGQTCR